MDIPIIEFSFEVLHSSIFTYLSLSLNSWAVHRYQEYILFLLQWIWLLDSLQRLLPNCGLHEINIVSKQEVLCCCVRLTVILPTALGVFYAPEAAPKLALLMQGPCLRVWLCGVCRVSYKWGMSFHCLKFSVVEMYAVLAASDHLFPCGHPLTAFKNVIFCSVELYFCSIEASLPTGLHFRIKGTY